MDLNKVMLIGRLTRDPELRTTTGGTQVCSMSIATGSAYTNQQTGQKVDQTEFHNIVLWSKLAEIAAQYLKKGTQVYIEGRLQTRNWEGQDGKKNYRTEVVANNMIMLQRAQGTATPGSYQSTTPPSKPADSSPEAPMQPEELPTITQDEEINVEDIPF